VVDSICAGTHPTFNIAQKYRNSIPQNALNPEFGYLSNFKTKLAGPENLKTSENI
jgi:hypothetical protein